jgi:hypothetical protein
MAWPSVSPTESPARDCGESADDSGGSSSSVGLRPSDYFWGVAFGLLGSVAINTGNNLQSFGMKKLQDAKTTRNEMESTPPDDEGNAVRFHARNEAPCTPDYPEPRQEETKEDINLCQSRIWIIGTFIFLTGSALNFVSYGLAAQSVLASLEAIQFVTNLVYSKFLLHVRILPRMMGGTVLICGGTVLVVAFGNDKNELLSFDDLLKKYRNPLFLSYLAFVVVAATLLHAVHAHYTKSAEKGAPLPHSELILPISYAIFSAFFGTLFVVQAKVFMKMLQYAAVACKNLLLEPLFYTTIITALPLVAVWLHRLNEALSLFEPIFIIPLIQSNFIIWAIISGGIYFEEFNDFSGVSWAGFLGGLIVIFYGLYQLRPDLSTAKVMPAPSTPRQVLSGTTWDSVSVLAKTPPSSAPSLAEEEKRQSVIESNDFDEFSSLDIKNLAP